MQDITALGERKIDWPTLTTYGVGPGVVSASSPYVTARHRGMWPGMIRTELRFTALPVLTGNSTGISFGSKQIMTFPEGRIFIHNCNAYFSQIAFNAATGGSGAISQTGSGDYSLGTTATADATLATTEVDLLPSTAMLDPFVAGIGTSNVWNTLVTGVPFDGTTTAKSMYLNVIIDDAAVADGASAYVYFTGYVVANWSFFGDDVTSLPALPA